jgi:hypothetical protein
MQDWPQHDIFFVGWDSSGLNICSVRVLENDSQEH